MKEIQIMFEARLAGKGQRTPATQLVYKYRRFCPQEVASFDGCLVVCVKRQHDIKPLSGGKASVKLTIPVIPPHTPLSLEFHHYHGYNQYRTLIRTLLLPATHLTVVVQMGSYYFLRILKCLNKLQAAQVTAVCLTGLKLQHQLR